MQIVDITGDTKDGWRTLEATVVWERRQQEPQRIHYSVPESHGHMVHRSPDPFLVSASMAAAYEQEPRVVFEDPVDVTLVNGVREALEIQRHARRDFHPPAIEGPTTGRPRQPLTHPTNAVMFSGGVDALATVQANRRAHTPDDDEYFRYGIVLGMGFDDFLILPGTRFWDDLEAIAEDARLELIPVQTNARMLQTADHFFLNYLFGPLLASIGHFLGRGLTHVSISSAGTSDRDELHGSHPDIDPLFSSGAVTVTHDLDTTSRFEKTRNVSAWPAVRGRMRVCLYAPDPDQGSLNCGRCEKCARTMLSLLALGKLEELDLFEPVDLTPGFVVEHVTVNHTNWSYYPEIADALHESGHLDLEAAVRQRLTEWQTHKPGFFESLKSLDQRLLGGLVRRTARRLR